MLRKMQIKSAAAWRKENARQYPSDRFFEDLFGILVPQGPLDPGSDFDWILKRFEGVVSWGFTRSGANLTGNAERLRKRKDGLRVLCLDGGGVRG